MWSPQPVQVVLPHVAQAMGEHMTMILLSGVNE